MGEEQPQQQLAVPTEAPSAQNDVAPPQQVTLLVADDAAKAQKDDGAVEAEEQENRGGGARVSRSRSRSRSRDRRRRSRSRDRHRRRRRYSSSSRSRSRDRGQRRRRRRSRSRSRDRRYRHRSRSPRGGGRRRYNSMERARMATVEDPFAKLRSIAASAAAIDPTAIAKQMQEQQLRARSMVLKQQATSALNTAAKLQKDVYVGNLVPGIVDESMLRQLFNATLQAAFPNSCTIAGPDGSLLPAEPVTEMKMHSEGKYCFVSLLSREMATAMIELNGQVSLGGQPLSIGRPTGYVDPEQAIANARASADGLARFMVDYATARKEAGLPPLPLEDSPLLCITGMMSAVILGNDDEYHEVLKEIKPEFERYGVILRIEVPRPSARFDGDLEAAVQDPESVYGRVYVQYIETENAQKAKEAMEGRMFDGRRLEVQHVLASDFLETMEMLSKDVVQNINGIDKKQEGGIAVNGAAEMNGEAVG